MTASIEKTKKIKMKENRGVKITAHVVMIVLCIISLAPFVLILSSSLTSTNALTNNGYSFWPSEFSIEAYRYIFTAWKVIGRAYMITIVVTVVGTVASLIITSMFAYVLHTQKVPGTKIIKILVVFTLLFNGGMVASYVIWTNIFKIQDTIFALILPNLLMNGMNVLLVMNYYNNGISKDFSEAAEIDGAGYFRIFMNIYMPLSVPILATIGMMIVLGYWNDWTNGLYYISDPKMYSTQLLLNKMNEQIEYLASNPDAGLAGVELPSASVRMAIAVISILPMLIAYPFFQKYFVAGITAGGVKG